ncbi:pantoate--beta-alanine ligase [Arthrobacter russicus]|uniref:Pantothenate synthetase n=1 Tax=Arthrobacter russicus TaxID=172040 RepID=A0ABU1JB11_9MICC|nr:pantoate--beta-alanine ligase [Arthrobacter russicus]MDN5667657.1 pantoate--beta-alanine ligase [Renibacterium salmoninarum]MDR6269607.1 pantoate--beta-alanine ligase [Arthrobacter russicus]
MAITVVRSIADLRAASARLLADVPDRQASFGLVPTMGALHAGHAELAATSVAAETATVVSIFVNPLQFGDAKDLERYPRTLESDVELLESVGVDLVFAPSAEEMYPDGAPMVRVSAGSLGEVFEGASRPGHFDGALTVVSKLLHAAQPTVRAGYRAYFGQKDAQQLALVQRMVSDLNFPVEIVPVPTVRAADGLALSSRNRFLSAPEREASLVLSRALRELVGRAQRREPLDLESAVDLVRSVPGVDLDYFEVIDPKSFEPLAENCRDSPFQGSALAVLAAKVGAVRLIDNMPLVAG